MDNETKNNLLSTNPLDDKAKELSDKIIQEDDLAAIKNIINEFNLNQTKKEALRLLKYNILLDNISEEMIRRFKDKPDEFTNSDLLQYLNVIQAASSKASNTMNNVSELNPITINQININQTAELPRESREKIERALKAILNMKNNSEEVEEVVIEENQEKEEDNDRNE